MAAVCDSCSTTDCGGSADTGSLSLHIHKIKSMISDNYTMLFVLVVVLVIIALIIAYFAASISKTIRVWMHDKQERSKNSQDTDTTDNPKLKEDDDQVYYDDPKEDPSNTDTWKYAPKNKQDFYKQMDQTYDEYNQEKAKYIKGTYAKDNDDVLDKSVMYQKYDDYTY